MKQQFVETIKIKNGKALALPYHQARMNLWNLWDFFNGEFYQLNRLNPVGKFRLFPAPRNLSWR